MAIYDYFELKKTANASLSERKRSFCLNWYSHFDDCRSLTGCRQFTAIPTFRSAWCRSKMNVRWMSTRHVGEDRNSWQKQTDRDTPSCSQEQYRKPVLTFCHDPVSLVSRAWCKKWIKSSLMQLHYRSSFQLQLMVAVCIKSEQLSKRQSWS